MADLVVKLLLKSGAFSNDLKTAKGQIQNFNNTCKTAGGSLDAFGRSMGINLSSITKLGSAIGVAAAAGKTFKSVMESNQTTADLLTSSLDGVKGVLDSISFSLGKMDFSRLRNGIWDIFDAAKALSGAKDQLGNSQIAYDYMSSGNNRLFEEAYTIYKDKDSTDAMKEAAKKQMQSVIDEQKKYIESYGRSVLDVYRKTVMNGVSGLDVELKDITRSQFEKAMRIDLGSDPSAARESLKKYYNQFNASMKELKDNTSGKIAKRNSIAGNINGEAFTYNDVVAVYSLLEVLKDDQLAAVASLLRGLDSADIQATQLQRRLDKIDSKEETPVVKSVKEQLTIQEGSLKAAEQLKNKLLEQRDATQFGTDEWKKYNSQLDDAVAKVDEIKNEIALLKRPAFEKLPDLAPITSQAEVGAPFSVEGKTIEQLQTMLDIWKDIRDTLLDTDPLLSRYNQQIEVMEGKMKDMQETGVEPKQESVDKWSEFGSTMSSVSTIVTNLSNAFKDTSEVTAASILQMIATTIPAIGQLIGSITALTSAEAVEAGVAGTAKAVSSSKHWVEAIAAVAALGGVIAASISRAQSAGKFADGGIVGGNSYTGDRLTASVNSGEMILNRSQQANLFRQINNGGGSNDVKFHISGTDLVGVLNNNNRKNRLVR